MAEKDFRDGYKEGYEKKTPQGRGFRNLIHGEQSNKDHHRGANAGYNARKSDDEQKKTSDMVRKLRKK